MCNDSFALHGCALALTRAKRRWDRVSTAASVMLFIKREGWT
nr:MAG TPA_asm: hypothetical protein [Caudoviricetes sp.]